MSTCKVTFYGQGGISTTASGIMGSVDDLADTYEKILKDPNVTTFRFTSPTKVTVVNLANVGSIHVEAER